MRPPITIRPFTRAEARAVQAGLRSRDAFTLRRSQILLARGAGQRAPQIAAHVGCSDQTVRNVLRAFTARGGACLQRLSSRPKQVQAELDAAKREELRALLHRSPRTFGHPRSTWTLNLAADVCFAQGLTTRRMSDETIRQALLRLGVKWRRAREWITSPDPAYQRKKSGGID